MKKKWNIRNSKHFNYKYNPEIKISKTMAKILDGRNIENIQEYLHPSVENMHDPMLLKGMRKSVDRIIKAIEAKEKIWIYGDYDVDGVSSTSILMLYFNLIGCKADYYIPNRLKEGYGINKEAISQICESGADLLISVDCGISSIEEVEYANRMGLDVIITDHHECPSELPASYSIINTKQDGCEYPFKALCGCGIALKLIHALLGNDKFIENLNVFLPITALATVCDVVSLSDENRFIVKEGLKMMKHTKNPGLKNLIKVCGLEGEDINAYHVGYVIGPRINAAGRLGNSKLGVELFTTKDVENAFDIAQIMDEQNRERQFTELQIHKEAEDLIKQNPNFDNEKVIVLAKEGWNHGIVGIVSSRITEKYYKPSILLSIEDGHAKGSARSIRGFNIYDALNDSKDLIEKFGGHEQAAGLTVSTDKLEELSKSLNEYADSVLSDDDMVETINCEFEMFEEDLNLGLCSELKLLQPFGMGNPSPKFVLRDANVVGIRKIGKNGDHLKMTVKKQGMYECIAFAKGPMYDEISEKKRVDLVFSVEENNFRNNKSMQLNIKDLRAGSKVTHVYGMSEYNDFEFGDSTVLNLEIKFNETFENPSNNTLYIVNTIETLEKIIFELENKNKNYSVNVNNIEENTENIQIIFVPHIDKMDFKRYNNIVILDFLYTIDDYNYLNENLSEDTNLYMSHDIENINALKKYIETGIPNREEMVLVYKFIKLSKKKKFAYDELDGLIDIHIMKILNSMKIFNELSLIDLSFDKDGVVITINDLGNKKVDLQDSYILGNLKKIQTKTSLLYESIVCKEED